MYDKFNTDVEARRCHTSKKEWFKSRQTMLNSLMIISNKIKKI